MSTVSPEAGRNSSVVRHELPAEPHDVGRARLLGGLCKAGGRSEIGDGAKKQTSNDR
jgi:hypothetical protein